MKKNIYIFILLLTATLVGCKREYLNPNQPTDAEVFSSVDGLTRAIVGLKQRYAVNTLAPSVVYQAISASALSTREAVVLNAGNADLAQVENGLNNLAPNNGVITSLWTTANVVSSEAQKIIDGSQNVTAEQGVKNGIRVYGHLYKAMALGTLATFWEQVPINTGQNAAFVSRTQALQEAVRLLDEASTLLGSATVPASFLSAVGAEVSLPNTLRALAARYYTMLGNNDLAIARAAAVSLTVKSEFFYNNVNPNPVFRSSLVNNNTYGVRSNFGLTGTLAPDAADQRIAFYLTLNAQNGSGFFRSDATFIPIYTPGEMLLIQAEAHARKDQLTQAVGFLNQVLTKTASSDAYGLGAGLPAYSGAVTRDDVLREIYRNRCIELYFSGMKLEDSRRFNRPGPGASGAERSRNFYPYPQQERDGNANTPPDPAG